MAKATSPIRLQQALMNDATLTGKQQHRSATEQVEYWADLGRQVSNALDPETLLSISAGLMRMKVEPIYGQPVNPDAVFANIEQQREAGTLAKSVSSSVVKYQRSVAHPGFLERLENNNVQVGRFIEGQFILKDVLTS